jgi:predicted transposase/invertase (TIGR01784 family)
MDQAINNPHDKFVKEMLADKDMAMAFLDAYLPRDLRQVLDLDQLQYANTQFMTIDLAESFSDIIFKIPIMGQSDKENYVSILLENKSVPDKYSSFQILGYLANGYLTQIKNKLTLHPIVPVVYYQGQKEWEIKPVSLFFDAYPEQIRAFVPNFERIFISLMAMSEESLLALRNGLLYSAIAVQKYRYDPIELEKYITRIFSSIDPYLNRNFIHTLIVYTLQVSEISDTKIIEIANNISPKLKDDIMSTYDQLINKGRNEGHIEGKLEGKFEGKLEVVLKGIENGLSIELLSNITSMSEDEIVEILNHRTK